MFPLNRQGILSSRGTPLPPESDIGKMSFGDQTGGYVIRTIPGHKANGWPGDPDLEATWSNALGNGGVTTYSNNGTLFPSDYRIYILRYANFPESSPGKLVRMSLGTMGYDLTAVTDSGAAAPGIIEIFPVWVNWYYMESNNLWIGTTDSGSDTTIRKCMDALNIGHNFISAGHHTSGGINVEGKDFVNKEMMTGTDGHFAVGFGIHFKNALGGAYRYQLDKLSWEDFEVVFE